MGDSIHLSDAKKPSKMSSGITNTSESSRISTTSSLQNVSKYPPWHLETLRHCKLGKTSGDVALFLLKVAALELLRRVSRVKCPFAWRGIQALQIFCCPPFKWIQRWAPLRCFVKGLQMLSRPLFVLSIATALFDETDNNSSGTSDCCRDSDVSDVQACEPHSQLATETSGLGTRSCDDDAQSLVTDNWLVKLNKELENQRITLPERINEDELQRFYIAANRNFSCLLPSIKKTVRWRETYDILSGKELEMWSHMVFWHGFNVKRNPCLVVRLGLACLTVPSHDRPRFAQAVVSQIEHGVLHLVDSGNAQITVVVDCEGISPSKVPMQMMRSCVTLLQNHFPERLDSLFVIRLLPDIHDTAQRFIQLLKPITQEKIRFEGDMHQMVLSEYIMMLPSYLGGKCTLTTCSKINTSNMKPSRVIGSNSYSVSDTNTDDDDLSSGHVPAIQANGEYSQILRAVIIGFLVLWIFIAIMAGTRNDESHILAN